MGRNQKGTNESKRTEKFLDATKNDVEREEDHGSSNDGIKASTITQMVFNTKIESQKTKSTGDNKSETKDDEVEDMHG